MNKIGFGVALGALVGFIGGATAADLYISPAAAPAVAPAYWGTVELGGLGRFVTDYNEGIDAEEGFGGGYGSFALWGDLGVVRVGVDGYGEWLHVGDHANSDITNASLGVLGAHIGGGFDQGYVGVFGGFGLYPDSDNERLLNGYLVGVEGTLNLDGATLFGKVGYADAPNDGGPDDEGFFGYFVEGGAIFSISQDLAVQVSGGYGFSSPFDTEEDADGYYATWGAKAAYTLGTDLNLNLVASYEGFLAQDSGDDEYVLDHTFKIGLSIPFGGAGAASALNPLATPTAPFRASVLADVM